MEKNKGCIHIYCGDGKGKTTASIGLAVRMAGYGRKSLFTRFLKNESSGELKILDQIKEIEVLHLEKSFGFYNTLNDDEKKELKEMYTRLWDEIRQKIKTGEYDLLVMDEMLHAIRYGLVKEQEVLEFLEQKPENLEVVITGRDPSEAMILKADYVSEIKKIKHPFDQGIMARKGIEY